MVPNPLAQVAVAIEHSHSSDRSGPQTSFYEYSAGQAFTAPRKQSTSELSQVKLPADGVDDMERQLDGSPRKRIRTAPTRENDLHPRVSFTSTRLIEEELPAPRP